MWATNSMLTLGMHHCCFTPAFYDLALEASVANGYRGKGVVYVFAVGSDASWCACTGSVQLWDFQPSLGQLHTPKANGTVLSHLWKIPYIVFTKTPLDFTLFTQTESIVVCITSGSINLLHGFIEGNADH